VLARVLMRFIAGAALGIVAFGVAVAWTWGGPRAAVGFGTGGALAGLSGVGLVALASQLLGGGSGGIGAGTAGLLLVVKLAAVLGSAWTLLAVVGVDGVAFLFGLGAGMLAVVLGAQWGQGSPQGQAAIRAEEARLGRADEEGEDSGAKSR